MKIWLSRPEHTRGRHARKRHLVLDMTITEDRSAFQVLRSEVIGYRGRAPDRMVRRDGTVRYRFPQEHFERLVATFPYAELSPGLERRRRRASTVITPEDVPELDIPDFRTELYDFQKIGVAAALEALDAEGKFFINDEMGLGKTVQALAVIVSRMYVPALVVCPNSAKWVWERMTKQFTDLDVVVIDSNKQRPAERRALIEAQADITVINVEALRNHPELFEQHYAIMVTDEFHRFKNAKAQQTEGWHSIKADNDLLMSGTPILNRVEEIWSALHRAYPERFPNYWAFERWICIRSKSQKIRVRKRSNPNAAYGERMTRNGVVDRHGRAVFIEQRIPGKVVGYKPDKFLEVKNFLAEKSIRRRKEQVLTDLPEVVHNTLLVDLTTEQRRLYNQIVRDMKLALDNGEITDVRGMLSMVTRAKQACFSPELYAGTPHSAKLDELRSVVQELVDSGEKAIIGSQWARATRILQRELAAFNPAYVDGTIKGARRMEQVDRFNEDEECFLYIGTIPANQEAITLSAASYVVFTDKMWSPLANDQFVARSAAGGLRGVGHDGVVNVIELFAHDTIEERIEQLLAEKRATFNSLVEVDGGTLRRSVTVAELRDLF